MEELFNREVLQAKPKVIRTFNDFAKEQGATHFLTLGEPDFPTPEPVKEAAIQALHENKTGYAHSQGLLKLREAISVFEQGHNGVSYSPEEILITAGATDAISTALSTILNAGDEVIVLNPAFSLYRQLIELNGAVCVTIDTSVNQFQLSKEMLAEVISEKTKAIVLTSPNNPTGTILNEASLEAVRDAVLEHEFFVVCDDVYKQLGFVEDIPSMASFEEIREYILVCQSFSKPYAMTGWRIGYLLADRQFIKQATIMHQYTVNCVATFVQEAAVAALDFPVEERVESFRKRRDYVYNRLVQMGIEVALPEGAFYLFPSVQKFGLSSWEFCERLVVEQKVALIPGEGFESPGFVRLSFCVSQETMEESLDRLEEFVSGLEIV